MSVWEERQKEKGKKKKEEKKRKKMLFICLMLGNFRLQQGSMEFVSPSQNVLRRHAEWELAMRGEKKQPVFGNREDTKENKRHSLRRSLFHDVQWMHVIAGLHCLPCCMHEIPSFHKT